MLDIFKGKLVVLAGHRAMQLSGDQEAEFLQEANFWYVTRIEEPGWKVIIDGLRKHTTMVRPETDEVQQIFNGGLSDDEARKTSGADEVISEKDFESYLRQLTRKHTVVYTSYDCTKYDFVSNPAQRELHAQLERIFPSVQDIDKELSQVRAIKTPDEIKKMKKASKITTEAFNNIRNNLENYKHEYEIEADFTRDFRRQNGKHAYAPIVASGKNACTLHYGKNFDKLAKNKMILIDIGARFDGYAADVTRTYCVSPTERQKQVHGAVESAHKKIIALLKPHYLISEYIKDSDSIMKEALLEIGLLDDVNDETTYRKYMPHSISHGLGVDVHEGLGVFQMFKPGMVLTVEPGIYIPEENIGVRIEDNILITDKGHENLTRGLSTSL